MEGGSPTANLHPDPRGLGGTDLAGRAETLQESLPPGLGQGRGFQGKGSFSPKRDHRGRSGIFIQQEADLSLLGQTDRHLPNAQGAGADAGLEPQERMLIQEAFRTPLSPAPGPAQEHLGPRIQG
jgi:hypothetical protein